MDKNIDYLTYRQMMSLRERIMSSSTNGNVSFHKIKNDAAEQAGRFDPEQKMFDYI